MISDDLLWRDLLSSAGESTPIEISAKGTHDGVHVRLGAPARSRFLFVAAIAYAAVSFGLLALIRWIADGSDS